MRSTDFLSDLQSQTGKFSDPESKTPYTGWIKRVHSSESEDDAAQVTVGQAETHTQKTYTVTPTQVKIRITGWDLFIQFSVPPDKETP